MKIKDAKDFEKAKTKLAGKNIYKKYDSELKKELIDLDMEMKYYVDKPHIYRRFIVVRIMLTGKTAIEASEMLGYDRHFGGRWFNKYKKEGIKGLYSDYSKAGRPPKLSYEKQEELRDFIDSSEDHYSIEDARVLASKKYEVEYTYNGMHNLTRYKLSMNYTKPFVASVLRPESAKDDFIKSMKNIDFENRLLFVCDEVGCQNNNRTGRSLHISKHKNIYVESNEKIKINVFGYQAINGGKPHMEITKRGTAVKFVISLINLLIKNIKSEKGKQLLKKIINDSKLSNKEIRNSILRKRRKNEKKIINDVNDKLYEEDSTINEKLKNVNKYVNRITEVSANAVKKEKEAILIELLSQDEVQEILSNEIGFDLVLDNAPIHTANVAIKCMELLNIFPTFLPTASPDLNPIEDVWRVIKRRLSNKRFNDEKSLSDAFMKEFYDIIGKESFYNKWLNMWNKN